MLPMTISQAKLLYHLIALTNAASRAFTVDLGWHKMCSYPSATFRYQYQYIWYALTLTHSSALLLTKIRYLAYDINASLTWRYWTYQVYSWQICISNTASTPAATSPPPLGGIFLHCFAILLIPSSEFPIMEIALYLANYINLNHKTRRVSNSVTILEKTSEPRLLLLWFCTS